MDGTLIAIAGISMFIQFAVLKYKFTHNKVADGVLDAGVFAAIMFLTSGSMTGMVIGIVGSTLFSGYLLWSPFNLDFMDDTNDTLEVA